MNKLNALVTAATLVGSSSVAAAENNTGHPFLNCRSQTASGLLECIETANLQDEFARQYLHLGMNYLALKAALLSSHEVHECKNLFPEQFTLQVYDRNHQPIPGNVVTRECYETEGIPEKIIIGRIRSAISGEFTEILLSGDCANQVHSIPTKKPDMPWLQLEGKDTKPFVCPSKDNGSGIAAGNGWGMGSNGVFFTRSRLRIEPDTSACQITPRH